MFQPVPTIFVYMFCCFVGVVGIQGSFAMMQMSRLHYHEIESMSGVVVGVMYIFLWLSRPFRVLVTQRSRMSGDRGRWIEI